MCFAVMMDSLPDRRAEDTGLPRQWGRYAAVWAPFSPRMTHSADASEALQSHSVRTDEVVAWATLALVVVTAGYAVLTWRLARSSDRAVLAAQVAAESAADSVRLQRAALEFQISQQRAAFKTGGGGRSWEEFRFVIRPLFGSYFVHQVELHVVDLSATDESGLGRTLRPGVVTPIDGTLPALVDEIGGVMFQINLAELALREFGHDRWRLDRWSCIVTYSLSELDGSVRRVLVESGR